MACFAPLTEAAVMDVLSGMAIAAACRRAGKVQCSMTLSAAHDRVQPQQRKARQIMVEADVAFPIL
jgi:hypothetical protein